MSVTRPVTRQLSTNSDVSNTVVMAVAATTNTPADELPPLHNVIDSDALNGIFQPRRNGQPRTGIHVSFTMAGCTVSIRDDTVTVTPDSKSTMSDPPCSTHAKTTR